MTLLTEIFTFPWIKIFFQEHLHSLGEIKKDLPVLLTLVTNK